MNWTLKKTFQWNVNRNSDIFVRENAFENVICKLSASPCRPQCVNNRKPYKGVMGSDWTLLGLYSLSDKTSYRKISWSLEAARFGFKLFQSLWNLAGTSAALLPRCLSNFRAIRPLQHPISRLRDFTRFGGKTSYRLVNRGPGCAELSFCIIPSHSSGEDCSNPSSRKENCILKMLCHD